MLTFLALIVGIAMVCSAAYPYVRNQFFHIVGGPVLVLFGAALIAFAAGAQVVFQGAGESGLRAELNWDEKRARGEAQASNILLKAIHSEIHNLIEDLSESGIDVRNPDHAENLIDSEMIDLASSSFRTLEYNPDVVIHGLKSDVCGNKQNETVNELLDSLRSFEQASKSHDVDDIGDKARALTLLFNSDDLYADCWVSLRGNLDITEDFESRVFAISELARGEVQQPDGN